MKPTPEDELGVYFRKTDLEGMKISEQKEILKFVKNIHSSIPWMPPLHKFSIMDEDTPINLVGGYNTGTRSIEINLKYIRKKGIDDMYETLAHEYGHAVVDYFRRGGSKQEFHSVKMNQIYDAIFKYSEELLLHEAMKEKSPYNYPVGIYFDKNGEIYYNGYTNPYLRHRLAVEETFTESMRFYFTGKSDYIENDEVKDLLRFIIPPSMKKILKNIFKKSELQDTPGFYEKGLSDAYSSGYIDIEQEKKNQEEYEKLRKEGKIEHISVVLEKARKTKSYQEYLKAAEKRK